jgi:hypothetical protein
MLVFVRPNSGYVRPKLKVIRQMSCQVKYLFAALEIHFTTLYMADIRTRAEPLSEGANNFDIKYDLGAKQLGENRLGGKTTWGESTWEQNNLGRIDLGAKQLGENRLGSKTTLISNDLGANRLWYQILGGKQLELNRLGMKRLAFNYITIWPTLAGSRGFLRSERNDRREQGASGHIGCKSHFHT